MATRKRPHTIQINALALAESWAPLAALKSPGFMWDGSSYAAARRGQAVDKTGLLAHMEPLKVLLDAAESGFPAHARLRDALRLLQVRHNIFGQGLAEGQIFKLASAASDRWRIMAKDVYLLKKQGGSDTAFAPLTDLIVLNSMGSCPSVASIVQDIQGDREDGARLDGNGDGEPSLFDLQLQGIDDGIELSPTADDLQGRLETDAEEVQITSETCRCRMSQVPTEGPNQIAS